MLKDILQGIATLVYPPSCLFCRRPLDGRFPVKEILCPACRQNLNLNKPPFCVRCSRYLGPGNSRNICRQCRLRRPEFDFAWSACLYEDPLKDLIHQFKYSQKTAVRHLFTELMTDFILTYRLDIEQFDRIAAVPLYAARLRERGYNQAQFLAEGVSQKFQIPLLRNSLVRARHTRPQTLLEPKERWTNIRGAFTIKRPDEVRRKNILIIDDLLTTGATASEAAHTLKNAGAGTVGILTLAITAEKN